MSGPVDSVKVHLSVVLGKTTMPINQLLRMGRGAVIELDATEESDVEILANNTQVALGEVTIQNDKIAVTVHQMLRSMRRRGLATVTTLQKHPAAGGSPETDESPGEDAGAGFSGGFPDASPDIDAAEPDGQGVDAGDRGRSEDEATQAVATDPIE